MKTKEFRQYACFRNGVEAIPSLLRRRYHVDKIPTHGKNRTRLYFGFKIAALDFQKLLDYINSLDSCVQKLKRHKKQWEGVSQSLCKPPN